MRKLLLFSILILISSIAIAQFEDQTWIVGYKYTPIPHPEAGYVEIDFLRNNEVKIDTGLYVIDMNSYHASIASARGVELYTNGCRIIGGDDYETIEDGKEINYPGIVYESACLPEQYGNYANWQGVFFLPNPLDESIYRMFHLAILDENFHLNFNNFLYTDIQLSTDTSVAKVISKNIVIQETTREDPFSSGLTATRHGNGRDWWIMVPVSEGANPRILLYLWDGVNVILMDEFFIEDTRKAFWTIYDQVEISSQGNKLAVLAGENAAQLFLFDFDRCNGTLTNQLTIELDSTLTGGISFSHSGRFLYHTDSYNFITEDEDVVQYDLHAEDVQGSREYVGKIDRTLGQDDIERLTDLWHSQRAPDGKIYVGSRSGQKHYHVINYPELKGKASDFEEYGLRIPKYRSFGIPLFPNYHVTAMPGTPCDTLGIGKAPYTKWNYQVRGDTVRFFDLSYYSPSEWSWDFGDGKTGVGAMPVHVYEEKGIYEVCLTAISAYGSDEFCMEIMTGTSSVREERAGVRKLEIYPNPVQEEVYISQELLGSRYEIVSMSGQRVGTGVLESDRLDVKGLQGGVYMIRVWVGEEVYVGKVVKM